MSTLGTIEDVLLEAASRGLGHLIEAALAHVLGKPADDTTKEKIARVLTTTLADQVQLAAAQELAARHLQQQARDTFAAIAAIDVAKLFTPTTAPAFTYTTSIMLTQISYDLVKDKLGTALASEIDALGAVGAWHVNDDGTAWRPVVISDRDRFVPPSLQALIDERWNARTTNG